MYISLFYKNMINYVGVNVDESEELCFKKINAKVIIYLISMYTCNLWKFKF